MAEDSAKLTLLENRLIDKENWCDDEEAGPSYCRVRPFILSTPAANAIQYVTTLWPNNLADTTSYMAGGPDGMPTDETDQLWNELYEIGISRLSSSEAAQLPNETAELPNASDEYLIQLAVFHQLHCLNNVRMALYAKSYSSEFRDLFASDGDGTAFNYSSHDAHHLGHCIDSLRMTVMCHSDVTPLTWVYDEWKRLPLPTLYTEHTCRDFTAIRDWAAGRAIMEDRELDWPTGPKEDFRFKGKLVN